MSPVQIGFKIQGAEQIQSILKKAPTEIKNNIQTIFRRIALTLVREVKKGTPVKTGRLRRSISYMLKELVIEIYTLVKYAIFQELGTRYIPAKHMFLNTYDRYKDEILRMISSEIDKAL